jgi:hypothetical protein
MNRLVCDVPQARVSLSFVGVLWTVLIGVVGCSAEPNPPGSACTPGSTVGCACPGGAAGVQSCLASGAGFGACECGSLDGGPLPVDMGPAPVCAPGSTNACACPGGASGTQICNGVGTGYGACECAPTCSPSTCDGCCEGSVCRTGDSLDACGFGGATCDVCGLDFECSFNLCTLESNPIFSTWGVSILSATVPTTDWYGSAWDTFGGAPDIQVCVRLGSSTATPSCTGYGSDSFSVTYSPGTAASGTPYEIASYLELAVFDSDVDANDLIGRCFVERDVTAPLPTEEQTANCARNDGAMTVGYTVRYRLQRL